MSVFKLISGIFKNYGWYKVCMVSKKRKLLGSFHSELLVKWLDHLTFPRIFLLWAIIILLFALGYFYLATDVSTLIHSKDNLPISNLSDCIYFSFITATTTGFGDITPVGSFKLFAIFEVVVGIILLALVTSRLVSIKQNVILDQIYDISISDNVNRLRLSLSTFINNLNDLTISLQEDTPNYKEVQEINFLFLQYEDILKKIISLSSNGGKLYAKSLNFLDNELLIYNLLNSLERITLFFEVVKQSKKSSQKLVHSRKILQRNYSRIDKFLDSLQDVDGEFDFESYFARKTRTLKEFSKAIAMRKTKDKV